MRAHKISLIKLTKLFWEPLLSAARKHTNTPTQSVCKGQIYFNKTSELQPQFHFDEFPPAGVSQAVGGRAERRESGRGKWGDGGWEADRIFMIVIFVIIQREKGGGRG